MTCLVARLITAFRMTVAAAVAFTPVPRASGVSVRGTVDTPFEKSRPSAEGTPSEVRVADISTSE
ncbi:hypothetical protein ACPCBC_14630 [Streptomyces incarnatus]|nr:MULTISPECIES: hypothetical protein [Streptomyces]